jgi:DNA-directed RNA polymerase specialized sigma24 family protein
MSRAVAAVSALFPIAIPTNQSFLAQWYPWTAGKVARHFKRDKERCEDTAQNVRLRLLSKNFIGRWFFKHLDDELVDKKQAEHILGGVPLAFIGSVKPVYGRRSSNPTADTAIYRVSDLLEYAKFDYERYFYSIQRHTIDSEKVLRLLGYESDQFSALESLYRQGKLKPAELTEHQCQEVIQPIQPRGSLCGYGNCDRQHYAMGYCSNHYHLSRVKGCPECEHGRELLRSRGLSLSHRWNRPEVADAVRKLRWNDAQLKPYLREWRRQNLVRHTPEYIMRRDPKQGIDAGLLAYAAMVIDHEVVNDFKRMSRAEDLSTMVLNNGVGPEYSDKETVAWDSDDKEKEDSTSVQRVIRDASAMSKFVQAEGWHDVQRLVESANLTDEESDIMVAVDLGDMSVRQYSEQSGIPMPKVHKLLASAHQKLQAQDLPESVTDEMAEKTAAKHGCTVADIVGPVLFGPAVAARTELFAKLFDVGMTVPGISARFGIAEERISAAINRSVLQEARVASAG